MSDESRDKTMEDSPTEEFLQDKELWEKKNIPVNPEEGDVKEQLASKSSQVQDTMDTTGKWSTSLSYTLFRYSGAPDCLLHLHWGYRNSGFLR